MPRNDHEKFEDFLKQFRPRAPRPLPIEKHEPAARRAWAFGGLLAAAAVLLTVARFLIGERSEPIRLPDRVENASSVKALANAQPLTLGRANALLVEAPSTQAAVDSLAFPCQARQTPKGRQSALAALAEENFKEQIKL